MMDNGRNVDEENKQGEHINDSDEKTSAVNSLILEYYKRFGKKRDLEQFFSLSTAQSEIRDLNSTFWKRMKALSDSSDSGDKKSESSSELCRISIRCSVPQDLKELQVDARKTSESESPPIITEVPEDENSNDESEKSDHHSLKSVDGTLDISINKPLSPTSSITSQRKLEWDSLADVGYGNESDKKTSASSLSTLERLALQQQYCISDSQHSNLGMPTAQSTPVEPCETKSKSKGKKGLVKKTTTILNKEVDFIEMNLPQIPEVSPPFNLNVTKQITFNVNKKGEVNVENITKSVSSSPEKPQKVSVETDMTREEKIDKEIQTSLSPKEHKRDADIPKYVPRFQVLTLKKRSRKKKMKKVKRQTKNIKEIPTKDKSGEQISAAESFEYMPAHIYHQNQIINDQANTSRSKIKIDNKSSLESSTGHTTDSSKEKNSFIKDLEKSIDLLKITLNKRHSDEELKKKLIKEIVQRLLKTRYKDDESTDFLSGLSFDSKKLDFHHTTSSTSDGNDTMAKLSKPKKSILRNDKFNSKVLPSTSQSTPNLPSIIKIEQTEAIIKSHTASNTDSSDLSKEAKTSSEELYQKYLKALKREQAYRQHLKEKDMLFKQKLVGSDMRIHQQDVKSHNRIKELMKDLVRNNDDDGSGDASKLEGGNNNVHVNENNQIRKQRSHSVFTLSSGTSESQQKARLKKSDIGSSTSSCSKNEKHYCCCPFHTSNKIGVTDSSVQVNIECCDRKQCKCKKEQIANLKPSCDKHNISAPNSTKIVTDSKTGDIKYVCLCKETNSQGVPDNILIYKCSRLDRDAQKDELRSPRVSNINSVKCPKDENLNKMCAFKKPAIEKVEELESATSKSSQTNLDLAQILRRKYSDKSVASTSTDVDFAGKLLEFPDKKVAKKRIKVVHEGVRWTQTEISIDPKISDPSFSDINIIDKQDCVKLVSEQFKEVSEDNFKTSSDEMTDLITDSSAKSISRKLSPIFLGQEKKKSDKEIQSDIGVSTLNTVGSQCNLLNQRRYSIPIEGTNMMLNVCLGEDISTNLFNKPILEPVSSKDSVRLESKETLTNKPTTVENSTSLTEECSVGVQSQNITNVNECFKQKTLDSIKNKEEIESNNVISKSEMKSVQVMDTIEGDKFHTFPKGDHVNPLKPLLRSNTDTGKIEKASHVTFDQFIKDKKNLLNEHECQLGKSKAVSTEISQEKCGTSSDKSSENVKESQCSKSTSDSESQTKSSKSSSRSSKDEMTNDPLIDLIQDITKRYSKKDIEKSKRKKCFKEIITVLNYLLDTEDNTDREQKASCSSSGEPEENLKESAESLCRKKFEDKSVQLSDKPRTKHNQVSDVPTSTDIPTTSTDSATCHVLSKIKRECERYHQKRCKSHTNRKCEDTSSTSNCDQCRRAHHCYCRSSKCHKTKATEKGKKKCVAYNLIVQSDSLISEETVCDNNRPLRNIVVKVPKRKYDNVPFKEVSAKIERELHSIPHCGRVHRSKSLPNDSDISSTDEILRQTQAFSVREYLERNRPDFVQKCSQRQNCLKTINETRASQRAAKRELLSVQVSQQPALSALSETELNRYAKQLGEQLRTKKLAPKFISERDMKKHSKRIYKSLPEVVRKKEEMKKESFKRTNLLLATIFKRNLQKKTLEGAVNLSNYSTIIKI